MIFNFIIPLKRMPAKAAAKSKTTTDNSVMVVEVVAKPKTTRKPKAVIPSEEVEKEQKSISTVGDADDEEEITEPKEFYIGKLNYYKIKLVEYNAKLVEYNAKLVEYNAKLKAISDKIEHYSEIVDKF